MDKNASPLNPFLSLIPASLFCFLIVLSVNQLGRKSVTYDEYKHLEYGKKILAGNPAREDALENSKMPVLALNALFFSMPEETKKAKKQGFWGLNPKVRWVTVGFSLLLAFLVFHWAGKLYGFWGGCLSLFLYVFSPNFLAHGRLATTDLYGCLGVTASLYFFWDFQNRGGKVRGAQSAFSLAVSQLTKYTCIFLYPIFLMLLALRGFFDRKNLESNVILRCLIYTCFFCGVSLLVINAGFLFDRSFLPISQYDFLTPGFQKLEKIPFLLSPFPYAFLQGLDWVKYDDLTARTFGWMVLWGQTRETGGFPGYYFVAYLFKTPLSLQILFGVACLTFLNRLKEFQMIRNEMYLIVPILFLSTYLNYFTHAHIGFRHFLVVMPLVFIFCGHLLRKGWPRGAKTKVLLAGLLLFQVISVSSYHPHYLSYMNELVGDRARAYEYLADSNLDWGQNQLYLKDYLTRHPEAIYKPDRPQEGTIIVSANDVAGVFGPENYRWLREKFKPVGHIAYSYLIYRIPKNALSQKNLA